MSKSTIFIKYGGNWDSTNNYVKHKVKIILVEPTIKYDELVEKLCKELQLTDDKTRMKISFDAKTGDSKGMEIENDEDLSVYLHLLTNDPDFKKCPIVVETPMDVFDYVSGEDESREKYNKSHVKLLTAPRCTDILAKTSTDIIVKNGTDRSASERSDSFEYSMTSSDSQSWDETESPLRLPGSKIKDMKVNLVFKSKSELKETLSMFAIRKHFEYKVPRSSTKELCASCVHKDCKWMMRARAIKGTGRFRVIKYRGKHECALDPQRSENKQATFGLVSRCIKENLRDPKAKYNARDIMTDMKEKHGVTISYKKAWMAKEQALNEIQGTIEESYATLPSYLHMLKDKNPGTVTYLEKDEENRFKYLFVAFGASIEGWEHCRPIIVVDGTFLTTRCGGTLHIACAKDSNNQVFPLAFGIWDSENNDACIWFLEKLKETFKKREDLVIISDMHKSIENGIKTVFPTAHHGICSSHLKKNLKKMFNNAGMMDSYKVIMYTYSQDEFLKAIEEVRATNPKIADYLHEVDPYKWARCFYPRNGYNLQNFNLSESINSVIKDIVNLPIVPLLEELRAVLQKWFSDRKLIAASTSTPVTNWANEEIMKKMEYAYRMEALPTNDELIYQVKSTKHQYVVDLSKKACSCHAFQLEGIPCAHALAAMEKGEFENYDFFSKWYSAESHRRAYTGSVNPVGDDEDWNVPTDVKDLVLSTPLFKSKPGRRRKTPTNIEKSSSKRTVNCGSCGETGHNKKSCKKRKRVEEIECGDEILKLTSS